MKTKKTKKADLENKRPLFFIISLSITLSFVLLAFSWKTPVQNAKTLKPLTLEAPEEVFIPVTKEEQKTVEEKPLVVDIFELVDNDTEIDDEDLDIFDTEATDDGIDIDKYLKSNTNDEPDEETIYIFPDEMPEFPGGMPSLLKFIGNNLKYPAIAQEAGVKGRVIVSFIIDKQGQVTNASIMRGVDSALDKEALRVVNMMPKWNPGKQGGRAVKVSYVVPINFVLQ